MNEQEFSGPNFCPMCRCNIKAIWLAIHFAKNQQATITLDPIETQPTESAEEHFYEPPAPSRAPVTKGKKPRMIISDEKSRLIMELYLHKKMTASQIATQLGLKTVSVHSHIHRKKHEMKQQQEALVNQEKNKS